MDSCQLGVIVKGSQLNWYMCFKRDNSGYIINIVHFAVAYTPTSTEVGEGITEKLALEDFSSFNTSSICLTNSPLVVALCLYGVLLVVTVLVYGRYGSHGMVE